ncbi:MAG: hypothetical protein KAR32_02790, partial [Candidatus Omnitrophica bacterium]|nr:hypothetical protein [Candidatus Omnitrophota bacterium]
PSQGPSSGTDYFTVNLLKRYIFSQKEKRMIKIGVNVVLALCALYVLTLGLQMTFKKLTIEKFQKSYSVQDYQQALDLKKKLK